MVDGGWYKAPRSFYIHYFVRHLPSYHYHGAVFYESLCALVSVGTLLEDVRSGAQKCPQCLTELPRVAFDKLLRSGKEDHD